MKLTVLGKSPSWQDEGGACSGYLVSAGATSVLIDCGNGVLAKLRQQIDYLDLDAVVITHIHADHVLDLAPLAYALTFSPRQQSAHDRYAGRDRSPPATGGSRADAQAGRRLGKRRSDRQRLRVHEYAEGVPLTLGPLTVVPTLVPHFTETFAMTVTEDERRFTFSADCAPSEALIEAARGNELLLAEATLGNPELEWPRGHMTATEAGEIAAAAGVDRLVLTHISDELDVEAARASAAAVFDGPVELAAEGAVYEI